jgi:hypothetical protein
VESKSDESKEEVEAMKHIPKKTAVDGGGSSEENREGDSDEKNENNNNKPMPPPPGQMGGVGGNQERLTNTVFSLITAHGGFVKRSKNSQTE